MATSSTSLLPHHRIPHRRGHPLAPGLAEKSPSLRFRSGHGAYRVRVSAVVENTAVEAQVVIPVVRPPSAFALDTASEVELREKGCMGVRKTKLVCTVGPACSSPEGLEKLAAGGMNVARLNMCHNTREWHRGVIRTIKRMNAEKGFCVSIMIDTEGSQMHMVDHGGSSSIKAEDGSIWLFTTEQFMGSRPLTVKAMHYGFSEGIMVGDELVIEGGMATFQVVERVGHDLLCRCTDPGLLLPHAKLSVWRDGKLVNSNTEIPSVSTKDWADIEFGVSEGADFIALSFVKDADDIKHLKSHLATRSAGHIGVLAKIESLGSLENLEEIVKASDGIMVARGDLGVQVPLEQIPTIQEEITYLCRKLNKPVIVASQLLESMIEYPIPTRAEVADVSEAVRQHADALMLSGESAVGSHAEKALAVLQVASGRMELWNREENEQKLYKLPLLAVSLPDRIAEQICNSAVEMANNLGVEAIFVYTKHGYMASLLSRNRPNPPIFAFAENSGTRMGLTLKWGVIPLELPFSEDMEDNIKRSFHIMKGTGAVKTGDIVLVVSDITPVSSASSMIQSVQVRTIS